MHDYKTGGGYGRQGGKHPTLGLTSGNARPMHNPIYSNQLTDDEADEIDNFVDDVNQDTKKKIHNKALLGIGPIDNSRVDRASLASNNHTGIFEFADHHMNTIRKGISPYPQPKHTGGPIGTGGSGQAFRTTGNYRRIGTQYGSSRPHKLYTDIEDNNIFNLSDMLHPMERSFKRQQSRVKKVLSLIKEYVLYEK
jgi:hypothetical protein